MSSCLQVLHWLGLAWLHSSLQGPDPCVRESPHLPLVSLLSRTRSPAWASFSLDIFLRPKWLWRRCGRYPPLQPVPLLPPFSLPGWRATVSPVQCALACSTFLESNYCFVSCTIVFNLCPSLTAFLLYFPVPCQSATDILKVNIYTSYVYV